MSHEQFHEDLERTLSPLLTPQRMKCGGHERTHPIRMDLMLSEMAELVPGFAPWEYRDGVWLHTLDRVPEFTASFEASVRTLLARSPHDRAARERIVQAVLEHSKKDDGPDDTPLLKALRLADKWDRVGAIGIFCGAAFRGAQLLPYDPEEPFGWSDTSEGGMKTLYHDFFRILEWYPQFPLIRELVRRHPHRLERLLSFIRAFGSEIAERHGVANLVERDLAHVLGSHYATWSPETLRGW